MCGYIWYNIDNSYQKSAAHIIMWGGLVLKDARRRGLIRYLPVLILFLCYLAVCLGLFFWQVGNAIEKNTLQSLRSNVQRQCYHFRSMLDIQFSTLESLADHMGRQESLLASDNLDLLQSAIRGGEFSRTMLITPDGTGYSSDDAVTHVGQRAYFQQALAGHRAVSDPLESSLDGSNKVVLAVPVRDHAHRVLGVLGGAYDLGSLSQFPYSGTGYSFIVTTEGSMVSIDPRISIEENSDFFQYYSRMEVHSGNSMEQIRDDFQSGTSGYSLLSRGSDLRYLVYEPSGMGNGWMTCYVVSADQALEDYRFIHQYEVILTAAFLVGMAVLLWYLLRSSFLERRALLRRAQSDPLTGLMNQAGTRESITDWLADGGCNGALLMLDLDHFKHVNDTWGHQVGDEVLRQAAAILQSHFRQGDIIGRMGGDEFMILMRDIRDPGAVERNLERLRLQFHRLQIPEFPQIHITCSVGASLCPAHGQTFEVLYQRADHALYQSKRRGRDSWCIYRDERPT